MFIVQQWMISNSNTIITNFIGGIFMKREKTIIVLITLLFSFVFFSCNDKSSNIKNESASFWIDSIVNNYGNGRIYGEKPVRYIDYDTMKSTVLCSKPNCTHQSSDCIANIIGDTPMLTENGIYFFNTVVEFEESNNGNRKQVINSKLCKVSLDSWGFDYIINII